MLRGERAASSVGDRMEDFEFEWVEGTLLQAARGRENRWKCRLREEEGGRRKAGRTVLRAEKKKEKLKEKEKWADGPSKEKKERKKRNKKERRGRMGK